MLLYFFVSVLEALLSFFFNLGYIDFPWNLSQNVLTCSPSHFFVHTPHWSYQSPFLTLPYAFLSAVFLDLTHKICNQKALVMLLPDFSFHFKKCWRLVHQPNYSLCTLKVSLLTMQHGAHSIPQLFPCL